MSGENFDTPDIDKEAVIFNLLKQRRDVQRRLKHVSEIVDFKAQQEARLAAKSDEQLLEEARRARDFQDNENGWSEGHHDAVESAVELYRRQRVAGRGGDIESGEEHQALLQLLDNVGVDPQDFDISHWKASTNDYSGASFDPPGGVVNLIAQKGQGETRRRARVLKSELLSARASFDKDRDGIPSGEYEYNEETGEFDRRGPVQSELYRYHGTVVPEGTLIDEFRLTPGNEDSENRPSIGVTPAMYSTTELDAAMNYAEGYNNFTTGNSEGQLYTLEITPDETVDLGECQDDEVANRAIRAGFDVIECSDFWEQPETIAFESEKVRPLEMHRVGEYDEEDFDDREYAGSDDPAINDLIEEGRLEDPVYVPRKQRQTQGQKAGMDAGMDAVKAAVEEYQANGGNGGDGGVADANGAGLDRGMEYRGMPKQAGYRARRGRGSMRY